MSETAALRVEEPVAGAISRGRTQRIAQPPEGLWAACVAAQVALAALLTSYTYFFFDDFLFLRQAQTQGFGRGYLTEGLFAHFSPVTRLLNEVVVHVDTGGFGFAHALQLALYAAAVVAFAFAVRTILGRTWIAFGLTVLFGQSVFLIRLLNWWTATANLLPATVFMLVALACYLRWYEARDRRWLVVSLASFAGALLDYETAMLFPAYLLLIRLLVVGDDTLDPRRWARTLWRERGVWAAYLLLDAAAVINYYVNYYVPAPKPSAGQVVHFLEISFVQAFVPALLGVARQPTPGTAAVIATWAVFCVAVGATLYLRPRAWRCLLVALAAFLLSLLPLGLNRIRIFGVYIGAELYYQQSAQFMFLAMTAFALSPRWGGQRGTGRLRWTRRLGARGLIATTLAIAAGYGALYVASAHRLSKGAWEPRAARDFFDRFLGDVDRVRARTGRDPDLIDGTVPGSLMPANSAPYNMYSSYLSVVDAHLVFDRVPGPAYVVNGDGSLTPARFAPAVSGRPTTATCVRGSRSQIVRVSLAHPTRLGPGAAGSSGALEVTYRMPARAGIRAQTFAGGRPVAAVNDTWGPGTGTGLLLVAPGSTVDELDVTLPPGACVSRVSAGWFVPAA